MEGVLATITLVAVAIGILAVVVRAIGLGCLVFVVIGLALLGMGALVSWNDYPHEAVLGVFMICAAAIYVLIATRKREPDPGFQAPARATITRMDRQPFSRQSTATEGPGIYERFGQDTPNYYRPGVPYEDPRITEIKTLIDNRPSIIEAELDRLQAERENREAAQEAARERWAAARDAMMGARAQAEADAVIARQQAEIAQRAAEQVDARPVSRPWATPLELPQRAEPERDAGHHHSPWATPLDLP
jgi:hypothetical protein